MDEFPLGTLSLALIVLLVTSGFFSIAETAMMAANRYRLKHQAQRGARGARLALALLAQTDKLLGVILLGNNLLNAAAATLASVITVRLFGQGEWPLALGTVAVTFLILVFSEITPKVVGAAHADRLAPLVSFVLAPLLRSLRPDRLVREPVRAGRAQGCFAFDPRRNPARRCRRKSCARWCSKARSISAASTRRCSPI